MKRTALVLALASLHAFAARPLDTDDIWNWRSAEDPRISPDGRWAVYVEGWNDRAGNEARARLWLCSTGGGASRALTEGARRDSRPRWSLDGTRIAWLSEAGGRIAIRIRGIGSAGESEIGTAGYTPLAMAWAPDGNSLAFTARVPAAAARPSWAPPAILPLLRPVEENRVAIFAVSAAGGAPRRISGPGLDCRGEPAWMTDGSAILTAAADGAIYSVRAAGGAERALTAPGRNTEPVPSPDGSKIAWLAQDGVPRSYSIRKLWVMNADGSRARALSGLLDRDAAYPQWSSDSRTVYFLADDRGSTHVYAARNDGTIRQATDWAARLRYLSLADNGRAVTVRSDAAGSEAVTAFSVHDSRDVRVLARPNAELLAGRETGEVEEIRYDSGARSVQAWLVKPPGFSALKKYPLLADVEDAPRRMYGREFLLRAQIYAAHGYLVLCANPRGTPGYGEEFGTLLRTRLPGDDFDDILRGLDAMASRPYVDSRRTFIVGGLLAAWAIGHTDRFAAAVARRPVADWTLHVATAPEGARHAAEWMGAMPWEDPDQYVKHSPVYFAGSFKTPTLVLAGDPDPESDELYFALRARKVDAALVRIPEPRRPGDCVLEMETILAWLGR